MLWEKWRGGALFPTDEKACGAARNWISGVAWPLDFNYFVGLYRITNSDNKKGGIDKIPPTRASFISLIKYIRKDGGFSKRLETENVFYNQMGVLKYNPEIEICMKPN